MFVYNGEPIELTYMMENGNAKDSWGFSMLVNGFQQDFFIDNSKKSQTMYTIAFEPNEIKKFNVSFTPICGKAGETLSVIFCTMLNPAYRISNKDKTKRYHEHFLFCQPYDSGNITKLTITVQPVYYSSGNNIGSQRKYETSNNYFLRVGKKTINSGNQKVTLFATLETVYSTATYTYHNIYGV